MEIIVQGVFRVDPSEREAYLAQSMEAMQRSRAEEGCLEYVFAADPVEADRVILSERWASQEDLDRHLEGMSRRRQEAGDAAPSSPPVKVLSREVAFYDATAQKPRG